MLFYTENVLKFAFSLETTEIDNQSSSSGDRKIGILGVPFDGTASYMPGARFGPRSVREASYNFERYNLLLDKTMSRRFTTLETSKLSMETSKKLVQTLKRPYPKFWTWNWCH